MKSLLALASVGVLATTVRGFAFPAPNAPVTTTLNGVSYQWQGTVAYGALSAEIEDKFGDTLGGIGSAISVKRFKKNTDGTYSGVFVAQPDRGHNTVSLENYFGRYSEIAFTMTPCDLSLTSCPAGSLSLSYTGELGYIDNSPDNQNGHRTSGLDASQVRTTVPPAFPQVLPETSNGALAWDAEGIALMADGTFWVSDEYGPAIYHIAADGTILSSLAIPEAILPHDASGNIHFTTLGSAPTYGRVPNQGFEGLTISPDNTRLYALVQSALSQDQDLSKSNRQWTRMVVYDITEPEAATILEQYVVQLPSSSSTTVFAQSEIYYVSEGVFMVLARDGKGDGNGNSPSSTATKSQLTPAFKNIGLITLTGATNINGLFDAYNSAVAPGGNLDPSITPALYNDFINIIDPVQLGKFGIAAAVTSTPASPTTLEALIDCKFESIAVQPVLDPTAPNDYFVFTMADNDFISTKEYVGGVDTGPDPYGTDVPIQVFVYRVTLPGATIPAYLLDQSINPSGLARSRARRSTCPAPFETCAINGHGGFECIDTQANLESCGGCPQQGGVDCSALPGVFSVECINGACVADACVEGFTLKSGVCA